MLLSTARSVEGEQHRCTHTGRRERLDDPGHVARAREVGVEGAVGGDEGVPPVGVGILVGSLQAGPLLGRQEAEPRKLGERSRILCRRSC